VGSGVSCKRITVILYSNFQIFVTLVTGVGVRQITFADPRTAPMLFGQESRTNLLYKTSYGELSVKIFKYSLPWQQGSSEQSLTDSIILTENPSRCKYLGVSAVQAKL